MRVLTPAEAKAFLLQYRLGEELTHQAIGPSHRSLRESRLLHEAHFHIFTAPEANECRNILHLALISLFDIAGASTTTDFRFYASHDEWIDVAWFDGSRWQESMKWFFKD
jgi:hypothetical protein